jgi:hypothetical protein
LLSVFAREVILQFLVWGYLIFHESAAAPAFETDGRDHALKGDNWVTWTRQLLAATMSGTYFATLMNQSASVAIPLLKD